MAGGLVTGSQLKVCFVGLALLLLSACNAAKPPPAQMAVDPTPVPTRPAASAAQTKITTPPKQNPVAPEKVAVAAPPAAPVAPVTPVAPAAKPPPPPPPSEPSVALEDLVGLQRTDVATLLGAPGLQRREPPGEVWQYRNGGCVLHVFLYEAPPAGHRVEHVEISLPEAMAARACLKTFLRAQASVPGVPRYASSLAP